MAKNKSNKSQSSKKSVSETVKKSKGFGLLGVASALIATLVALTSFYIYNEISRYPDIPNLDHNEWWGPLPMDAKPDVSIKPYKIEFSDVIIHDLKERLLHRRPFTPPLDGIGFQYGFNTNFLTRVLDYWQNSYNFKDRETFLNQYDQYMTNVQGLDIHYLHVKPKVNKEVQVVPLLLIHGWPGSVREFYEIIPKLTKPREGYNIVFEVIAPSLPGYGFSQAASRPGLSSSKMAVLMNNLMKTIGHTKYYVQGGDWGHLIGSNIATLFPDNVLGFHTNMPVIAAHPIGFLKTFIGIYFPSLVVEPEVQDRMYPWGDKMMHMVEETGYLHIQATKPDTIGVALTDSPAGLVAYILEKFSTWTNPEFRKAGDGELLKKYALTHLLDNVMIYWATNSITTSMRLYADTFSKENFALKIDQIPTSVPTWGIKFKHELGFQPDSILKLKYLNYLHSTIVDDGGHFAAFEMPDVMADDIFKAVKTFREFHNKENKNETETQPQTIYDFTVKDINGNSVNLSKYKGHILIIVNVASQCGLTATNYKELNELYAKYSETKGLRILAFPCNQFNGQEPGSSFEIKKFLKENQVKFDVFQKIEVNGESAAPLWKFLKTTQSGTFGDFVKWNFSKFIIDKNGIPVERFGPNVNPSDLESYLAKYW